MQGVAGRAQIDGQQVERGLDGVGRIQGAHICERPLDGWLVGGGLHKTGCQPQAAREADDKHKMTPGHRRMIPCQPDCKVRNENGAAGYAGGGSRWMPFVVPWRENVPFFALWQAFESMEEFVLTNVT